MNSLVNLSVLCRVNQFFFLQSFLWYTRNIYIYFFSINWTLRMSDNLPERVQILYHAHIICITVLENRIILQSVHLLYKYAIRINFCFIRTRRINFSYYTNKLFSLRINKWILYLTTMYVFCVNPAMSKKVRKLVRFRQKGQKQASFLAFHKCCQGCLLRGPRHISTSFILVCALRCT
jgi:hypothetical protein